MFQTCFRRIHVFLVVMRCPDWPEGRHIDDGFRALNECDMGQIDAVDEREKKIATDCSRHKLHTVEVLNLTTGAWSITLAVHGYIYIATKGPLSGEKYVFLFFQRRGSVPFPCYHHLILVHARVIGATARILQLLPENYS